MIGRVPRHTSLGDGIDPDGLFVFIPGAIASGFLISLGLLAGDAFRSVRGDSGNQRRIRNSAAVIADEVREGAGAGRRAGNGLRRPAVYGIVSLISLALVVIGIPGATWNFLNPVGYISDIGWIWALSLLIVIGFGIVGVQTHRLVPGWLPLTVALLGLGFAIRFAVGSETGALKIWLIAFGLVTVGVGAILAWRAREKSRDVDVPPSVRPLLARTPLASPE
ncbi:MAG: hypothetical protein BMS9Abin12_1895 [Acidimicrobiia bacterium]|nr:MAG: hypothetical protein BMS9Abin12_1895 [Acidimicrobiia bacterium]